MLPRLFRFLPLLFLSMLATTVSAGDEIRGFVFAMIWGVIVGTYSSIFVATPVVLLWHRDRRPDLAGAKK